MVERILQNAVGFLLAMLAVWLATRRCPVCWRKLGERSDGRGDE